MEPTLMRSQVNSFGRYTAVPLDIVGEGKKRVDVESFYDSDRYRPSIVGVMGLPIFLC